MDIPVLVGLGPVRSAIPAPPSDMLHVGPFMVRYYALMILLGIGVAGYITQRRYRARGGEPGVVLDVLTWGVPAGILGARLYHVITSPGAHFGAGGDPVSALYLWRGGLSVWGGIIGGTIASIVLLRRRGIPVAPFAGAAYHPTFLYESLWALGVAALVWWIERRLRLDGASAFAVYVAGYTAGRLWIETMRVDPASTFFGVRLNVFTSAALLLGSAIYLAYHRRSKASTGAPAGAAADVAVTP